RCRRPTDRRCRRLDLRPRRLAGGGGHRAPNRRVASQRGDRDRAVRMTEIRIRAAGDRGALLELPDGTAAHVARVLAAELRDLVEVVPGHRTVLVTWAERPPQDLAPLATRAIHQRESQADAATIEIPVVYDGSDLGTVSGLTGLSVDEIVATHTTPDYTVA